MSEKFLSGKVVSDMKKSLDNAKIGYDIEAYMTENQFKTIGRVLGKTEEEIQKLLNELSVLDIIKLNEKL